MSTKPCKLHRCADFDADALVADLSLALDLLEKHQGDCWTDSCLSCSGVDGFHELDCALAQLLERHGREVRWAECPVPGMGASVLRENHWYERRWASTHESRLNCWMILRAGIGGACIRHRGHDGGAHEPRGDEL